MYNIFNVEHQVYNKKLANSLVLRIKAAINEKDKFNIPFEDFDKQQRYKYRMLDSRINNLTFELFNLMSKVVTRNIRNYVNLVDNSPVTEKCHEKDEMTAECYLILQNCIDKFKLNKGYCFYFYFNKSLSRNFFRYFKKKYQEKDKFEKYQIEKKYTAERETMNSDIDLDLLIHHIDLDKDEELLVRSKVNKESKNNFIEKNPSFNTGKYYSTLKRIKDKLKTLKEYEQI